MFPACKPQAKPTNNSSAHHLPSQPHITASYNMLTPLKNISDSRCSSQRGSPRPSPRSATVPTPGDYTNLRAGEVCIRTGKNVAVSRAPHIRVAIYVEACWKNHSPQRVHTSTLLGCVRLDSQFSLPTKRVTTRSTTSMLPNAHAPSRPENAAT